jgi:hypothetical protein
MQGTADPSRVALLDAAALCRHLVAEGSVYGFLADHRRDLFPDELFADLFPSGRGRPSVPAEVITTVMVLQALEGLSDREAAQQLACNIACKVVAGLALTNQGFHPTVLSLWRTRRRSSRSHCGQRCRAASQRQFRRRPAGQDGDLPGRPHRGDHPERPGNLRLALWPLSRADPLHHRQARQDPDPAPHEVERSIAWLVAKGTAGCATAAWPATSSARRCGCPQSTCAGRSPWGWTTTMAGGCRPEEAFSGPGVSMRDVFSACHPA